MFRADKSEKIRITLTVNRREHVGFATPRTLLSDFLRHELGLFGTHVGCEHGVCGACTILIDGRAERGCGKDPDHPDRQPMRRASPPSRAWARPRTLLSDFLRHELGLFGTHVGCEHGVCGACTILIDGRAERGCLTLAVQAMGRAITTVEGLGDGGDGEKLSALQAAFSRHGGLQCGYCTPGILASTTQFLAEFANPTETEVRDMLSGHICRCTGYDGMVRAILEVAGE